MAKEKLNYYIGLQINYAIKLITLNTYLKVYLTTFCFLFLGISSLASSQSITLLGGNTLNGALNGVALGGATMALQNSNDFAPTRTGLGLGILYGIGVGIYDISQVKKGEQFYISGTFNDGTNTSILVLLDTFYGAAAGAVVASSFKLIANEPIVDGLQYGSGAGAWAGFAFGLIDAFVLAKGPREFGTASTAHSHQNGLVTYVSNHQKLTAEFFNTGVTSFTDFSKESVQVKNTFNIQLVNISIRL